MRRRTAPGRGRRASPLRLFALLAVSAGAAAAVGLRWAYEVPWLVAYLVGANVATVLLYAYDKAAAVRGRWVRVPELVLHAAALAGGTPAALVMQRAVRHKTIKPAFRRWFTAICLLQLIALCVAAFGYHRGGIRF